MENLHREGCPNEGKNMSYALMDINGKFYLVSAREMQVFDEYLEYAKDKDRNLNINMEESDNAPFSIVYGGVMFNDSDFESVAKKLDELKGYAFLDLDRDKELLSASTYADIVLYPEFAKMENFIPFAAYMQTTHPFDNEYASVTMFPLFAGYYVWEQMVNKPFLLACKKKVEISGSITIENWRDCISADDLLSAYAEADLYTGPTEEDE